MKYKVGDRVRIVDHRTSGMACDGNMDKWLGKVMTIKSTDGFWNYSMVEDQGEFFGRGWYWTDTMIAGLAEKEPEPWTEEEIQKARDTVAYLAYNIVYDGGDLRILNFPKENNKIEVAVWPDSFDVERLSSGVAKPYNNDPYNPWIGKCVALCKALRKPIPDFIMNKNRGDE